jgi:hypothetical protein
VSIPICRVLVQVKRLGALEFLLRGFFFRKAELPKGLRCKASWVLRRKHYNSTFGLKGFKTATSKCAKSRSFRVDTVRP